MDSAKKAMERLLYLIEIDPIDIKAARIEGMNCLDVIIDEVFKEGFEEGISECQANHR